MSSSNQPPRTSGSIEHYDAVVIGAGVSGMYALHHLREMGFSVRVYDGASDVGGTWWYNRYPGARVDGPGSPFYCYTFSDELMNEWDWAETQSEQSDVLAYLEHVADRFDLRRDIQFETWVQDARYDEAAQRWTVETSTGVRASAQFLICAVGALSTANMPDIPGIHDFAGECYHTGRWPHEPVSFEGKRVAVIGTGSSGIQAIPEIAREAAHVTVLQRTPQYAFPAGNRPITPEEMAKARESWDTIKATMIAHGGGFPSDAQTRSALEDTPEQREALYEKLWQRGGFGFFLQSYNDIAISEAANKTMADFVKAKIRAIVRDPAIAEKLMPDHFVMTKRPILDNGYFETFNRDNVTLVDLREDPIERFTPEQRRHEDGRAPDRHARAGDRLRCDQWLDAPSESHGTRRREPEGAMAGPFPQLSRSHHRRLSQPVHAPRPRFARRLLQHAARRRAADGLDRQLHAPTAREGAVRRRAHGRQRRGLGQRGRRNRQRDALPPHRLLVDRSEHPRQAPLLLRLPGWLAVLPPHLRGGGQRLRRLRVRAGSPRGGCGSVVTRDPSRDSIRGSRVVPVWSLARGRPEVAESNSTDNSGE